MLRGHWNGCCEPVQVSSAAVFFRSVRRIDADEILNGSSCSSISFLGGVRGSDYNGTTIPCFNTP